MEQDNKAPQRKHVTLKIHDIKVGVKAVFTKKLANVTQEGNHGTVDK
jgi:hypothetical protein